MEFSAGAVSGSVDITVQPAADFPNVPELAPGTAYDFGPDGTSFDPPVTLTISYDPALLPPDTDENGLVLGHLIDGVWTRVAGSVVNTTAHTVSGSVSGFSPWVILIIPIILPPPPSGPFAYTSTADGDKEVYVRDSSGTHQITDNTANDGSPDWLDGSIAFHSDRAGNFDIWTVDDVGGNAVNLTNSPSIEEFSPHWSPDGSRIGYTRRMSDGTFDVWVMNADGSGHVNLTDRPGHDAGAAWSPDGSRIAFQSRRNGSLDVYVMNSYGNGTPTQLTFDATKDDGAPDWSPDGQKIAFSKFVTGTEGDIWTMNADDGSDQERVTFDASLDFNPAWSVDGSQILFERLPVLSGAGDVRYITVPDGLTGPGAADPAADERSPAWQKASVPIPPRNLVVTDQVSCESLPAKVTWTAGGSQCTLESDLTLRSVDALEVRSPVRLVVSTATLTNDGGTITIPTGGRLSVAGALMNDNGGTIQNAGFWTISGVMTNALGSTIVNDNQIVVLNTVSSLGSFANAGTLTTNSLLSIGVFTTLSNTGTITNTATIN